MSAATDDAEEQTNRLLSASVSDLELVYSGGNQVVGLRFPAVAIASGGRHQRAYIQFVSDGIQSEPTNLLLQGQAADNPGPFVAQLPRHLRLAAHRLLGGLGTAALDCASVRPAATSAPPTLHA